MAKEVVPEEGRRRRRPTKQGVVVTQQLIVETALRMLHEHGRDGLTVRRLGIALGADPSTLYRYFRGIDDLTLAIADELIGRALRGWRPGGEWRNDLREVGLRIHTAYLAHPEAAVLTASRVSGRANEIAGDEAVLGILRSTGLPDTDVVRIYQAFVDQALAFAALDAASLALPEAARAADERVWRATYARLPAETHPNIAATAPLLVARMNDSAYPTALEMLLDSAAAAVRLHLAAPEATAQTGRRRQHPGEAWGDG
ncbi:TetR/AcrR family transcriptional regulator [Streptomyces sp. ID03-2B]|uniref:TetR/AcrR family transcriptional regulator n=1 Tax=unclassified Streptomyces TaxID=2593676 RepID=UPI0026664E1F|nr:MULTISPECIES: TetR/AcrR family transcriptional regulator [unclassified Streptomyces]MDX3594792.1 TetR/AcrR family transcriptional regulator [Streptomyces sp. ID03-2B]WKN12792.1 TetR/AcrR family transcriptional regulator [Streptomyces sp. JUS-F4]